MNDDELFYLSTLTSSAKTGFHDGRVKQYKGKLHYLQTKQYSRMNNYITLMIDKIVDNDRILG